VELTRRFPDCKIIENIAFVKSARAMSTLLFHILTI
jgi:hypothetical protein